MWLIILIIAICGWLYYKYRQRKSGVILEAKISSPDSNLYKVTFSDSPSETKPVEHILMVLCFASKMLHIIDYDDPNQSHLPGQILGCMKSISSTQLSRDTDIVSLCNAPITAMEGVPGDQDKVIHAKLYPMNPEGRFVNTSIPMRWFRDQFLFSWLALIQQTLPRLTEEHIELMRMSLGRLVEMYVDEGVDYSVVENIGNAPSRAFAEAAQSADLLG